MHVWMQKLTGIAVLGSMQIQKVASLLYLVIFPRQFVPRPIALPLMMLQGLRLARLLGMSLPFVLLIKAQESIGGEALIMYLDPLLFTRFLVMNGE